MSERHTTATGRGGTTTGSTVNTTSNNSKKKNQQQAQQQQQLEYNPRWKGYVYIAITSLVNFSSISNIPRPERSQSLWIASMTFGVVTFTLSMIILLQDRSQQCLKPFHYTKASNGYFEGYLLIFCVLWWIGGVAYITRVDGIAYVANNIYYTSWLCLFSCIYTLNEWSASKDILSIDELTGVSATLKSWYVLFLSSLVVMGTCADLTTRDGGVDDEDTMFGIALGLVSTIVALFFVLVHYNFIPSVENGGMLELFCSFLLILLWIIGLAIFTRHEGIAATLSGTKFLFRNYNTTKLLLNDASNTYLTDDIASGSSSSSTDDADENQDTYLFSDYPTCTIVVYDGTYNPNPSTVTSTTILSINGTTAELSIPEQAIRAIIPCSDLPRQIPGSNIYFAAWVAFAAALNIPFRWKAAQALHFAQAAHQQQHPQQGQDDDDDDDDDDEVDDDDSDDDYEDAI